MNRNEFKRPSEHIPYIAAVLAGEHFPTGELAALKHMALDRNTPLAFYRFILQYVDTHWQTAQWQNKWRTIICALSLQRGNAFDPQQPWGKVLAKAGFSAYRLERLLASRDETLHKLILYAAQQIATKGFAADWRQPTDILFCQDVQIRENINRHIACDYYRAAQLQNKEN